MALELQSSAAAAVTEVANNRRNTKQNSEERSAWEKVDTGDGSKRLEVSKLDAVDMIR